MKSVFISLIVIAFFNLNGISQYKIEVYNPAKTTITAEEYKLYTQINSYRKKKQTPCNSTIQSIKSCCKGSLKRFRAKLKEIDSWMEHV